MTRGLAISRPRASKNSDARRPEQAEALQQRAILGAVGVTSACSSSSPPAALHGRVGEGEALHLLARDAPVGIEVEHHRRPAGCSSARRARRRCASRVKAQRRLGAAAPRRAPGAPAAAAGRAPPDAAPTNCSRPHGEHQRGAAPQAVPAAACAAPRARCGPAARSTAGDQQQQPPSASISARRQHRLHRSRCATAEQQHAEEALDAVHPGAGARQQRARRRADAAAAARSCRAPAKTAPCRRARRRASG